MIETKEQYEEFKVGATEYMWTMNEWQVFWHDSVFPTIEALREVARAAEGVVDIEQTHWSEWSSRETYKRERLAFSNLFWDRFNDLPDWLTDES